MGDTDENYKMPTIVYPEDTVFEDNYAGVGCTVFFWIAY